MFIQHYVSRFRCHMSPVTCHVSHVKCHKFILQKKNPAHGRHRISRPMLIEAPYREKKHAIICFSWGIWWSGDWLLCTLQQSPGLHFYPLNFTALLSYAVHLTKKSQNIYVFSMPSNSIPWTHWTSLYGKLLICSALQCTGLQSSLTLHSTALHWVKF